MAVRINPDFFGDVVWSLSELRQSEDRDFMQLASGRKLNSISDDPAAVADLVVMRSQVSEAEQFIKNVSSVRGSLQIADSTLNSVVAALNRAMSLAIQGANGTLSAANRQALAVEVRGIQQQLLSLANTSYQGNYVFAGTAVTTHPFVMDPASSSVAYQGNAGTNTVQIGEGQYTPAGLPGSQIFNQTGSDVFAAVNDLAVALESGGDVAGAATGVQNAFQQVNKQRAFYGSSLARLNSAEQFLNAEQLQLTTSLNDLEAADMAAVISDLNRVEIAKNAALAAASKASQLSLLDYLK